MTRIHRLFAAGASSLLLALALTPAALAAGSVSAGSGKLAAGNYKGTTSQKGQIAFTVSSGHVSGGITWAAKCSPSGTFTGATNFRAALKDGKFAVHGRYKAPVRGSNGTKFTGHFTASIAGTVRPHKAHGTFSGKVGIFKGSKRVATCKSGAVKWHARKV